MSYSSKGYTVSEIKHRLRKIYEEERENHKGMVEFFPVTFIEYYRSPVFLNNLSLANIGYELILPIKNLGVHYSGIIAIFIDKIKRIGEPLTLPKAVEALYHELNHEYQDKYNKQDLKKRIYEIEKSINCIDFKYYKTHYREYYLELETFVYGISKTIAYLEENGLLSDDVKKYYIERKQIYEFMLFNYDFFPFLKKFHKVIKTGFVSFTNWMCVLYNWDGTIKSMDIILKGLKNNPIDSNFLNLFFSSEDFLNSLDFSSLMVEQQNIIINALQTSYNLDIERYKNNFKFLKGGIITQKMVLKANSEITKRLVYYTKKLEELKKAMGLNTINENSEEFKK